MGNTPSKQLLLAGDPTEQEIELVDEALTAYEMAHRYSATLAPISPERNAGMRQANMAARLLERLANNGVGRPGPTIDARQRLAVWRAEQTASGNRVGVAEEIAWLCDQLDATTT